MPSRAISRTGILNKRLRILACPSVSAGRAEGNCLALVIIYIKRDPGPDERRGVGVVHVPMGLLALKKVLTRESLGGTDTRREHCKDSKDLRTVTLKEQGQVILNDQSPALI